MERESEIQDDLKDLIESATRGFRFHRLEMTKVKRDHPVDRGKADLVLFMRGETPFMFVETKPKWKGRRPSRLFDPLDVSAVGQVMCYAAEYKREHGFVVPFVATANPDRIAVFRTPENVEDYIDRVAASKRDYRRALKPLMYHRLLERHVVLSGKFWWSKEYVQELLDKLAGEYVGRRVIRVKPTEALIGRFREFVERVTERCRPLVEAKVKEGYFKEKVEEELGYKLDPDSLPSTVTNLTRMMATGLIPLGALMTSETSSPSNAPTQHVPYPSAKATGWMFCTATAVS